MIEPQPQAEPQTGQGSVPDAATAVVAAKPSPPLMAFGVPLARGPNGKLYNPAKGPPPPQGGKSEASALLESPPKPAQDNELQPRERGIKGLDVIPKDWPQLPGSVSLGVEVSWVQENRLAVVKELPSGAVKVDLTKAYGPAPSRSALSWLETSIRSYAKFIEVASKQASSGQDEAEFVRRERMQLGEIRALLEEMKDAGKGKD